MSVIEQKELNKNEYFVKFKWDELNWNILSEMSNGSCLKSSINKVGSHEWQLELYPDGFTKEDKGFLTFFLKSWNVPYAKVSCLFSICNDDDAKPTQQERGQVCYNALGASMGFYVSRERVQELLTTKGNLIIFCKLEVKHGDNFVTRPTGVTKSVNRVEELDDFEKLLKNPLAGDITLKVQETKIIYADKKILMEKSKYFADLLSKNDTNQLDIKVRSYETFMEILRFIYSGKVHNIHKFVKEVKEVAESRQLSKLAELCENVIQCKSLTDEARCSQNHSVHETTVQLPENACPLLSSTLRDERDAKLTGVVPNEVAVKPVQRVEDYTNKTPLRSDSAKLQNTVNQNKKADDTKSERSFTILKRPKSLSPSPSSQANVIKRSRLSSKLEAPSISFSRELNTKNLIKPEVQEQTQSSCASSSSIDKGRSHEIWERSLSSGMKDIPSWLKTLRLQKYTNLFKNLSYNEMLGLTEDSLTVQEITGGARRKLFKSIQILQQRYETLVNLEKILSSVKGNPQLVITKETFDKLKDILVTPLKPSSENTPDDIPSQFIKVLEKICNSQALKKVDDAVLFSCIDILEKVLNHECFTTSQKKKVQRWQSRLGILRFTNKHQNNYGKKNVRNSQQLKRMPVPHRNWASNQEIFEDNNTPYGYEFNWQNNFNDQSSLAYGTQPVMFSSSSGNDHNSQQYEWMSVPSGNQILIFEDNNTPYGYEFNWQHNINDQSSLAHGAQPVMFFSTSENGLNSQQYEQIPAPHRNSMTSIPNKKLFNWKNKKNPSL